MTATSMLRWQNTRIMHENRLENHHYVALIISGVACAAKSVPRVVRQYAVFPKPICRYGHPLPHGPCDGNSGKYNQSICQGSMGNHCDPPRLTTFAMNPFSCHAMCNTTRAAAL